MLLSRKISTSFNSIVKRTFQSALYITGDKASDNFSILTPHIDIQERFKDKELLQANIDARCLHMDLDKIATRWDFFMQLNDQKHVLSYARTELSKEITKLMADPKLNHEELEKLRAQAKMVKNDLQNLKEYLYGVEEAAAVNALGLPNVLHSKTPVKDEAIVHTYLEKPAHKTKSHIEIGTELIEAKDNSFVYLKNDAAIFEFAISNYFHSKLLDLKFTQFSNSDFAKSVVVEGCGTDYFSNSQIITLEESGEGNRHEINRLHLTGGASHFAFMAYFTKNAVQGTKLPLKFFASGRKYQPITNTDLSLFNLQQQSAVELFVATKDLDEDLNTTFDELVKQIINIYEPLGYHFRLVILPASKISKHESLRLSVQMFSNFLQSYVEVAYVSICDNYLSKRLLFSYSEKNDRNFPKVITSSILNVHMFLACAIENHLNKKDLLCELLKQYAPL